MSEILPTKPTKPRVYYAAVRLEIDGEGHYSADVRQILNGTQDIKMGFDNIGPLILSDRVTSPMLAMILKSKLKLFT